MMKNENHKKIEKEIGDLAGNIIIPLMTTRSFKRETFENLLEKIKDFDRILGADEMVPRAVTGVLFETFCQLLSHAKYVKNGEEVETAAWSLKEEISKVYGPKYDKKIEDAPIKFYKRQGAYGIFSNFAHYPIEVDGKIWPTSEHYFQAQKFKGTSHEEEIRLVKSPMDAAKMGRDRNRPIRPDWDDVKDDVMRCALKAKVSQHSEVKEALLSTGGAKLIEHTSNDNYWADGGDGKGRNMLGKLLMEIRDELQQEIALKFVDDVKKKYINKSFPDEKGGKDSFSSFSEDKLMR